MSSTLPQCKSYAFLAQSNTDHFSAWQSATFKAQGGAGAWEAYASGHSVACDWASKKTSAATKKALAMNACASHYLSDLFAPGHQNGPRRAVIAHADKQIGTGRMFKNFYTKWAHDEANQAGMNVENRLGMKWRAYGDRCNYYVHNWKNRLIQNATLSASAQLVMDVARGAATVAQCKAQIKVKALIPDTAKLQNKAALKNAGNLSPMWFSPDGKTLLKRGGCWDPPSTRGFCDSQNFESSGVDRYDTCLNWWNVLKNTFGSFVKADPCGKVFEGDKHNVLEKDKVCKPALGMHNQSPN